MNRFALLFIATILLSVSVFAAPVSNLALTLVNPPAQPNKDLNFQLTWTGGDANVVYWMFDSDGNSIDSGSSGVTNYLVDGFDVNTIGTSWITTSGNWNIITGKLTEAAASGEIYRDTGASTSWAAKGLSVSFTVDATNVGVSVGSASTIAGSNGYRMTTGATEWKLKTIVAGVDSDRLIISSAVGAGTRIKWTFDTNGLITGYKNDVPEGSIYDTNFSAFRYAIVDASTGGGIRDINITSKATTTVTISSGISKTHSFSGGGAKTIQATVQNPDGNASTKLDLNASGYLNLQVWDENTGAKLSNATIDFNGGTYSLDANASVQIPLNGLTTGTYTINVDVNSAFTSRDFVYDLNQFSVYDLNLLMLETSKGTSRDYKIYQPNQTTLITNSYVEWRRTQNIKNGIAQRTKTSSTATVSFLGQQDANYVMRITDSVAGVMRDYNGTTVTVVIPKDVETLSNLTNYSITVGGLATQSYTGLSANHSFKIFSDTSDYYDVTIDFNSEYYSTSFLVKTTGGQATYTINPYLVSTSGNLEASIFTINNPDGRISLPNIRIESYTIVGGSTILVESKKSDGTGLALFHFVQGKEYTLYFYNTDGNLLMTKTVVPATTELYAFMDLSTIITAPVAMGNYTVIWQPQSGLLEKGTDGNYHVSQILQPRMTTIGDVNVVVSQGDLVIFQQIFSINSSVDYNLSYDFNVEAAQEYRPIKIKLIVKDTNGVILGGEHTNIDSINDAYLWINGVKSIVTNAFSNFKDGIGQLAATILFILFCLILVGSITRLRIAEDNNFLILPLLFLTFIGVVISFISFDVWLPATFFGLGLMAWRWKQ